MKITRIVTYEINDLPDSLTQVCIARGLVLTLLLAWDHGAYRLRLYLDQEQIYRPKDREIEADPDYAILGHSDYDGGYNWDGLTTDLETSYEFIQEYAEYQRARSPGLQLEIDSHPAIVTDR